jgi:hypothetical protein
MDILVALKQEQVKLQQQLKCIQGAIFALNGSHPAPFRQQLVLHNGAGRKRTMSGRKLHAARALPVLPAAERDGSR